MEQEDVVMSSLGLRPEKGLDTKTDFLTAGRNVILTLKTAKFLQRTKIRSRVPMGPETVIINKNPAFNFKIGQMIGQDKKVKFTMLN
jgi:hypothetical protein